MKAVFTLRILFFTLILSWICSLCFGQASKITINLGMVDNGQLNKKAMFDYQVNSTFDAPKMVTLKGALKYRNSPNQVSYSLNFTLQPGINNISEQLNKARFEYSSATIRELFELFDKLPEGMYQYCVSISTPSGEANDDKAEDCIFGKVQDVFLINLIDPEDKAEIYEFNPMLSWVVNYPFSSSLTYKIKVVEMKKNQNAINAIKRNRAVYEEGKLTQMSINYPIYAKPLEVGNTYAWTVDAFYKGQLLGGAEPWQFTIIEDSLWKSTPRDPAYVDIDKESGRYQLYAPGVIKLKYVLNESQTDTLQIQIFNKNNKEVQLPEEQKVLNASYGDNRFILALSEFITLSHLANYTLKLTNKANRTYLISFKYINPDFLN